MGTMEDVLCFLNELDFADELHNDSFEKFAGIKKMLVREIEDYNISKKINA